MTLTNLLRKLREFPLTGAYGILGAAIIAVAALSVVIRVEHLLLSASSDDEHLEWVEQHASIEVAWFVSAAAFFVYSMTFGVILLFERRAKQRTRQVLQQEVEFATTLQQKNVELEKAKTSRADFLMNVTHELNTPLTVVLAFCHLLDSNRDRDLTERDLQHIGAIRRNAENVSVLVKDLISMSELENGLLEILPEPLDLEVAVNLTVESMQPIAMQRKQVIRFISTGSPVTVFADPKRVDQVVMNTITNAIKYSPDETGIEVEVGLSDDVGHIAITDHGSGIEPDEVHRIWEPFYRVDNEVTRSQSGSGLGLSIVRRIVDMHGGTVELINPSGEGMTVRLSFPLSSEKVSGQGATAARSAAG